MHNSNSPICTPKLRPAQVDNELVLWTAMAFRQRSSVSSVIWIQTHQSGYSPVRRITRLLQKVLILLVLAIWVATGGARAEVHEQAKIAISSGYWRIGRSRKDGLAMAVLGPGFEPDCVMFNAENTSTRLQTDN